MSSCELNWDETNSIWHLFIRGRKVLSLRSETVHDLKQEIDAKMQFKYIDSEGNPLSEDAARTAFSAEGRPRESEAARRWREMTADIDQL